MTDDSEVIDELDESMDDDCISDPDFTIPKQTRSTSRASAKSNASSMSIASNDSTDLVKI